MKKAFIYDDLNNPVKRRVAASAVILPSIPDRLILKTRDKYGKYTIFDALSGAVIIRQDSSQADIDCVIADADYRIKKWIPEGMTFGDLVQKEVFDKGISPIPENIKNYAK